MARDGIEKVNNSISRIRSAVRYIRSSPQRSQQFNICCEQEKLPSKCTLCLDVPSKWNYTYLMLETVLKFQKAFERLDNQEQNLASNLNDGFPNEGDWENAKVLIKFVKTFYEVTKRISGSLYVTANSYLGEVFSMQETLDGWSKSSDDCLSVMARLMKENFDKYWGKFDKINMMLLIAVVLDPQYKLTFVKFCYSRVYTLDKVNELIGRVRELLNRMHLHYQMLDSTSSPYSSSMTQILNDIEVETCKANQAWLRSRYKFLKYLEEQERASSKTEVDRYLEDSLECHTSNFEILGWWKMNSSRYRILSQVARDVLAIPISTIASESAFSTGERILDQFHGSLTPKIVECLICTQDWLRASPLPIEVEERLEELEDLELVIMEDPGVAAAISNSSTLSL
ncbi:hypothetical protein F0562_009927 [Nyssa sinensis]|uniref:HAT C-terminal dimerisation domain-containing protein n=1 Tax=Nyssa sinensis TaxID=561372 RepID=A0A5J5A017_9ASTE|nr:hypothetical protein F0562_009927 [Nyssa sinensis]